MNLKKNLTGALDKTVLIWRLPDQLVSQSILIDRLRNNRRKVRLLFLFFYSLLNVFNFTFRFQVADWAVDDVSKWLHEVDLPDLVQSVQALYISGRMLLRIPEEIIIGKLQFDHDQEVIHCLE